jgi:DivIVA domain-containing protein
MGQFFLLLIAALVVGAIVFGVAVLITGDDQGIEGHEPDGRAVPLPASRPLGERDVSQVRFDTAIRGYRMAQVDAAFRRAAYDIGYKEELIQVLEAEVIALREGRTDDADALRRAREAAASGAAGTPPLDELEDDEADKADDVEEQIATADDEDAAKPEPPTWSVETDSAWRSSSVGQ